MTVANNQSKYTYDGNGTTGPWNFPRYFIQDADLQVIKTSAAGVDSTLTNPADYSLTGAGSPSGGFATTTVAVAVGEKITVSGNVDYLQGDSYPETGLLPAKTVERGFDRLTMMVQQVKEITNRCLRLPISSIITNFTMATPAANCALVYNATGDGVVNGPTATDITNAATNAATATAAAAAAAASAAAAAPNANFTATSTTGTNAYTCNTGATSRVAGQRYLVNFSIANTNTNVTLNDNGLGAANIRYKTPAGIFAPAIGDLSGYTWLIWDGTQYQVIGKYPFAKAVDVASAATTDFTQSVGDYVTLTGTTNITAMTLGDRDQKTVIYTGAGLNITLGASLTLNNLATGTLRLSTNDVITIRRDGSVTKIIGGQRANGSPISTTGVEVSIASATTTDLGSLASKLVSITGTTTITSFGSTASTLDPIYFIQFAGVLTLTHNGTSLIIPGSTNITTAAGDMAIVKYEGSGNWRVLNYMRASGLPVVSPTSSPFTTLAKRTPGAVTTDLLTGLPAGVKMVIISFLGLTKGGTSDLNIQIGPSGGVATSGYVGVARGTNVTAGMYVGTAWSALGATWGTVILTLAEASSNTWTWQGDPSGGGFNAVGGGGVALSGALERILITDQGGTPGNFTAGSWQVTYLI